MINVIASAPHRFRNRVVSHHYALDLATAFLCHERDVTISIVDLRLYSRHSGRSLQFTQEEMNMEEFIFFHELIWNYAVELGIQNPSTSRYHIDPQVVRCYQWEISLANRMSLLREKLDTFFRCTNITPVEQEPFKLLVPSDSVPTPLEIDRIDAAWDAAAA